ncbi:uncharacterized protein LOC118389564 isoform X1 [Oncorhynchus keta]|uniref:uncharacterized protein LOC118389564 isoform X1 n=1 Tax=Oncorhynchus keta TaxID=8018 RepID=UPI0015F894D8|nr:uncharacterized protein LOC118389564 isoform X1 [Oncorhynchus keta]
MDHQMCAAMRGVVLLFLLSLWAGDKVDAQISEANLAKLITEMKKFGLQNREYAMAVRLTKDECKTGEFDVNVEPEVVKAALTAGQIYKGDKIIAAIPYNGYHAEYRLLSITTQEMGYPILHLTNNNKDCIIFFTTFSPCLESCMKERGGHSIINDLDRAFRTRDLNSKAFVFEKVWQPKWGGAKTNPPRQNVLNSFNTIHKKIPLYRCTRSKCYYCNEINTGHCLEGYSG